MESINTLNFLHGDNSQGNVESEATTLVESNQAAGFFDNQCLSKEPSDILVLLHGIIDHAKVTSETPVFSGA